MTFSRLTKDNRAELASALAANEWMIACLCAAWCGSCRDYEIAFAQLAARHPDTRFIWIDIEDEAEVVGDFDVDNFPTLLIQHGTTVTFFGTIEPDIRQAERILTTHRAYTDDERLAAAAAPQQRVWQQDVELLARLQMKAGS